MCPNSILPFWSSELSPLRVPPYWGCMGLSLQVDYCRQFIRYMLLCPFGFQALPCVKAAGY